MYIFDYPSTFLSPSIQTANISKTNWCFLCKWTLYSKEMIRYGCYCKTKARLADNSRREFLLLSTTNAIGHSVLQLAHQRYASHIGLWIPKILGFSRVSSSRLHRADNGSSLAGHRCCKSCLRGPVVSVLVDWWWCASHFASSTTGRLPTAPALPMPFQCTLHIMRIIFIKGPCTLYKGTYKYYLADYFRYEGTSRGPPPILLWKAVTKISPNKNRPHSVLRQECSRISPL